MDSKGLHNKCYTPITKEKLLELIKDAPNNAVINVSYGGGHYTADIKVSCEIGAGATGQRNIIFLDAKSPYAEENHTTECIMCFEKSAMEHCAGCSYESKCLKCGRCDSCG